MKQLAGATFVAAVLASLALVATGLASTSSTGGVAGATKAAKLPALPSYVKSRHKWVIGVKCDFPPFGYYDFTGNHRGYDVAIARRFATIAFGRPNRVKLVCVTTPSRIPTLQSSQVDIIISTLTWTAARAEHDQLLGPRTTRRRDACSFRTTRRSNRRRISRQDGRHDAWRDLRDVDAELLQEQHAARGGRHGGRGARRQGRPCRRRSCSTTRS